MPHARTAHADDLLEITTRNRIARHIIEGFSLVFPTLNNFWLQIDGALADALAGRATIAAYLDGESRPLSYVRDELHAQGFCRPRGDS